MPQNYLSLRLLRYEPTGIVIVSSCRTTRFYAPIVGPLHAGACQVSCPDCLRDFSNLAFQNILDWRLGLNLARLRLDPSALMAIREFSRLPAGRRAQSCGNHDVSIVSRNPIHFCPSNCPGLTRTRKLLVRKWLLANCALRGLAQNIDSAVAARSPK
jgi:hypothetical protein